MTDQDQQQPLDSAACWRIPSHAILRLTGADRQSWLHNFCTADIKSLEPGQGCEAFILNVKGKTMAHAIVLMSKFDLMIVVIGVPEVNLVDHFDRYIIREDVQLQDLSKSQDLWYAQGDRLDSLLANLRAPQRLYQHGLVRDRCIAITTAINGGSDWLFLTHPDEQVPTWYGGLQPMPDQEFDRLRMNSRFPVNGRDVTLDHLPQEFCRDEMAISFTKGCYLGQETVARIDALGHVNYLFVNLQLESAVGVPGLQLLDDDKVMGSLTSVVDRQGLGFVRRIRAKAGEVFSSAAGQVTVA